MPKTDGQLKEKNSKPFQPKALNLVLKKAIRYRLNNCYRKSQNATDKTHDNLFITTYFVEQLYNEYIIPRIQQGQTTFAETDGKNELTFKRVLQSQAQSFVSWLSNVLTGHGEMDLWNLTPSGSAKAEKNASYESIEPRAINKEVKKAVRDKLTECYRISQNLTDKTPEAISHSAEQLYSNYIMPKIRQGKTRFTVDDGMNDATFKRVLQSQAQPFVSWLNDYASVNTTPIARK